MQLNWEAILAITTLVSAVAALLGWVVRNTVNELLIGLRAEIAEHYVSREVHSSELDGIKQRLTQLEYKRT